MLHAQLFNLPTDPPARRHSRPQNPPVQNLAPPGETVAPAPAAARSRRCNRCRQRQTRHRRRRTQRPAAPAGAQLALAARYGSNLPQITSGLHWRIYPAKPDQGGFRPLKEDRGASPVFSLPPGNYVVHVGFGLASATRTIQLRADGSREIFEIPAGGLRIQGRVGDARIPPGQSGSTSSPAASSSRATAAPSCSRSPPAT